MKRLLRSTALAAVVLSAPAFAFAAGPASHDDAGLSPRATAAFTSAALPADGLSPGTSHDDATYAPYVRAQQERQASTTDRGEERQQVASRCTCGHQG